METTAGCTVPTQGSRVGPIDGIAKSRRRQGTDKDDLGDQEEEAYCDTKERREEDHRTFHSRTATTPVAATPRRGFRIVRLR